MVIVQVVGRRGRGQRIRRSRIDQATGLAIIHCGGSIAQRLRPSWEATKLLGYPARVVVVRVVLCGQGELGLVGLEGARGARLDRDASTRDKDINLSIFIALQIVWERLSALMKAVLMLMFVAMEDELRGYM